MTTNRRNLILAGTLLLLLGSASRAYGYWMNQLESDWVIPVAYPVTLSILYEENESSDSNVSQTEQDLQEPNNSNTGADQDAGTKTDQNSSDDDSVEREAVG